MMKFPLSAVTCALRSAFLCMGVLIPAIALLGGEANPAAPATESRWFRGNLHTHSLWSDGDDYPEMVADWYKREGYHFLAISDHNRLQQGERWFPLRPPTVSSGEIVQRGGGEVLEKYLSRFGPDWVKLRERDERKEVRLQPLAEYRSLLEEPGRFLMIPSEEITSSWKRPKTDVAPEMGGPVHINLINPRDLVTPAEGDNALTVMQRTIDAALAQRVKTGQPMFPHINHPNFVWGITAEELMQLHGAQFFEVYNGHASVRNTGDAAHLGTEEMWDAILTRRLAELHLPPMFGLGVDDSHHYHSLMIGRSNPGRGWIMVRARHLTAESLIAAMEAGDFYASSGVTLTEVRRSGRELALEIQAEPGVTYVTKFIGTRRNYDPTSQIIPPPAGEAEAKTLPHRRYSKDVGTVFAEVSGLNVTYTLEGDELYVRAKVISSKPKPNASVVGEVECAWTQPLVNTPK